MYMQEISFGISQMSIDPRSRKSRLCRRNGIAPVGHSLHGYTFLLECLHGFPDSVPAYSKLLCQLSAG